jgi:hypothetical protein
VPKRLVQRLAHDVEAGKLERRQELGAIVVEAAGRIRDLPAQALQVERVVPYEVGEQCSKRRLGTLAATAHLAQADQPLIGLDLDDGAHEVAPVAAIGVPQRSLQRHGHRGGAQIGDRELAHGCRS